MCMLCCFKECASSCFLLFMPSMFSCRMFMLCVRLSDAATRGFGGDGGGDEGGEECGEGWGFRELGGIEGIEGCVGIGCGEVVVGDREVDGGWEGGNEKISWVI